MLVVGVEVKNKLPGGALDLVARTDFVTSGVVALVVPDLEIYIYNNTGTIFLI